MDLVMKKTIHSADDLRSQLQSMVKASSNAEIAVQLGVTRSMVSDLLRGKRDFSERIARSMGYRREIIFRRERAA